MDLTTAYRYNQNIMEYYTCKSECHLIKFRFDSTAERPLPAFFSFSPGERPFFVVAVRTTSGDTALALDRVHILSVRVLTAISEP